MLRFLIRQHPLPTALLVAALAGLLWFASSFVREVLYFSDPAHQQQDLALWMSPRYVGKSWDLPAEVIVRTMELEPDHAQPTLRHVIDHLGITLEELQSRVEAAKVEDDARRAAHFGGNSGDSTGRAVQDD